MIDLADAAAHIGRGVVYVPTHGPREDGVITSVGAAFIFVRYAGDTTSKATRPVDLEWLCRNDSSTQPT